MNKLKNTSENKSRFFGQYLWQIVVDREDSFSDCGCSMLHYSHLEMSTIKNKFLRLTPLSQISDEDVMLFFELSPQKVFLSNMGYITKESPVGKIRNLMSSFEYIPSNVVDGLRSKGYALPWMGLSVDDLVNYGWVKLKGGSDE